MTIEDQLATDVREMQRLALKNTAQHVHAVASELFGEDHDDPGHLLQQLCHGLGVRRRWPSKSSGEMKGAYSSSNEERRKTLHGGELRLAISHT